MEDMSFHKVEALYGKDYALITKVKMFSFNEIKSCFDGKHREGDIVIRTMNRLIEDPNATSFSSEDITEFFSSISNRAGWIQESLRELGELTKNNYGR